MENLLSYIRTFKANNLPFDECDQQIWINVWNERNPNVAMPDLSKLRYFEYSNATILFDGNHFYAIDDDGTCLEVSESLYFHIDIGDPVRDSTGGVLL